jgi:hypothetical protein
MVFSPVHLLLPMSSSQQRPGLALISIKTTFFEGLPDRINLIVDWASRSEILVGRPAKRKGLEKLTRKNSDARSRNTMHREKAAEKTCGVFQPSDRFQTAGVLIF